ncbi:uncharacterized protein LOC113851801 [Abrus precatorius]|uniref:Uncharacterized protein LOC113851801 n=1 Tax=Abrus precatorius TaxID=3816 RepID=A0A8B8K4K3_ABRPR|nr:uncharacterized protein LOC113851801 [Abrus precatorius]
MANWLKLILVQIIGEFQSAFVPGRLISDNGLIALEIFDYLRKKKFGSKGYMGLKLDMTKAYDRLEWNFLLQVFRKMEFLHKWVDLIWRCVSTPSFSALHNGIPCTKFTQSPYLFNLYVEVFLAMLIRAQIHRAIHGIKVARYTEEISFLFFAVDSIIFNRASD